MNLSDDPAAEEAARLQRIYRERSESGRNELYEQDRPEVKLEMERFHGELRSVVAGIAGSKMAAVRFLDVGCGRGELIHTVVGWGVLPQNTAGTELIPERLEQAEPLIPEGPLWHLGPLETLPTDTTFDVVTAITVFSSILDQGLADQLAQEMWRRTSPGGVAVIYDFRYDNPRNPDVRKVTHGELAALFPSADITSQTMTLAPPLSRAVTPRSVGLANILLKLSPLRSHMFLTARKTP